MADPSFCAEIIWKIENFLYCDKVNQPLKSETFVIDTLDKTSWYFMYYTDNILLMRDENDKIVKGITAKIETAVLDSENKSHFVSDVVSETYQRGSSAWRKQPIYHRTIQDAEKYLQENVFTIRCRIWLPENNKFKSNPVCVLLQTQIPVSECLFHWNIDKFLGTPCVSCKICFDSLFGTGNYLDVTLSYNKNDEEYFLNCKIRGDSMLNNFLKFDVCVPLTKKKLFSIDTKLDNLPFIEQFGPLIPQKEIVSGSLLLLCKIAVISGDVKHGCNSSTSCKIKPFSIWYLSASSNIHEEQGGNSNQAISQTVTKNCNTLKQDTLRMYKDKSMSDFTIQVGNRKFPVHALILTSRSPVFHTMLQTNMKEKLEKILKLDELDEDTVQQMLEYMYSDDPGKLSTDSALKLYYAGDQYQIWGLKEMSALYLKQNVNPSNVCNIFQLADQHNDESLKSIAVQFIKLHEKEIILSEDFETLSTSNPKLCFNIVKELTKLRE